MNIHPNSIPHVPIYSPKHPTNGKRTLGHRCLDPYTQRTPPSINSASVPLEEGSLFYSPHSPQLVSAAADQTIRHQKNTIVSSRNEINSVHLDKIPKGDVSEFITLCQATIDSFSTIIYASLKLSLPKTDHRRS